MKFKYYFSLVIIITCIFIAPIKAFCGTFEDLPYQSVNYSYGGYVGTPVVTYTINATSPEVIKGIDLYYNSSTYIYYVTVQVMYYGSSSWTTVFSGDQYKANTTQTINFYPSSSVQVIAQCSYGYTTNVSMHTYTLQKAKWVRDGDDLYPDIVNARDAANAANQAAQQAKSSADTAASMAQTSVNQTWYSGKYGGSSESTADVAGYIRMLSAFIIIESPPQKTKTPSISLEVLLFPLTGLIDSKSSCYS